MVEREYNGDDQEAGEKETSAGLFVKFVKRYHSQNINA